MQYSATFAYWLDHWNELPACGGIYVVDVPDNLEVCIFDTTTAIREYNQFSLIYPSAKLIEKFERSDKKRIYIGKADNLRTRIHCLLRYGKAEVKNHRGGRAIWQLKDTDQLLLGYEPCENPILTEKSMIRAYIKQYGVLPLANWRE